MATVIKKKSGSNDKECRAVFCAGHHHVEHAKSGSFYGLGVIGAAVYFIGQATTFWMGVLGFLKALVWPAFIVYYALKALGVA